MKAYILSGGIIVPELNPDTEEATVQLLESIGATAVEIVTTPDFEATYEPTDEFKIINPPYSTGSYVFSNISGLQG